MAIYRVKVRGKEGLKQISVSAGSPQEARKMGERAGRVIAVHKEFGFSLSAPFQQGERQIFFSRLSSMLSSRVGTSDALGLLRDTFTGKIQEVSGKLLNYVETGDDLAGAIAKVGQPDFPEATVALIQAGSRSGETWRAIRDASEFEYQLHTVKKSASKGLWSAVIGFFVAGFVTVGSSLYVGPKILESDLIKSAKGVNVDWILTAGNIIGWIMAVVMLIAVMLGLLAFVGKKILPVQADKLILKIPFYKDLVLSRNNFIVLYGLALLIKSGVRTEEALRLSGESAPKGALRTDLVNATKAVRTGKPWPRVMETLHPTDKAALLCAVDREQVYNTLDTLANQYREIYAQRLASFVPAMQLVSALFLSLGGAVLFGASILPILQAANGLG